MEPLARMTLSLLVGVKQKEGYFLAICPFLNQVSRGETASKALQNLIEEIEYLFEVCSEDGSLATVVEHRVSLGRTLPPAAELTRVERVVVALPPEISLEFLKQVSDAAAAAD